MLRRALSKLRRVIVEAAGYGDETSSSSAAPFLLLLSAEAQAEVEAALDSRNGH